MLRQHFSDITLVHPAAFSPRPQGRLRRLSGLHLGLLFKTAVNRFLHNEPFDLLTAWRDLYPLPTHLGTHLSQICRAAINRGIDPVGVISSSLTSDPLVHRTFTPLLAYGAPPDWSLDLSPEVVFKSYEEELEDVEFQCHNARISSPGQLQREFCEHAATMNVTTRPWETANRIMLFHLNGSIPSSSCASCLIRTGTTALGCRHSLCDPCSGHYSVRQPAWKCLIDKCPACARESKSCARLKPPTAEARVLILSAVSPKAADALLEGIRSRLFGPLQDYFDLVVCSSPVSAAQSDAVGLPLCDGPGRVEIPADPKLGSRMIQLRGKLRLSSSRLFRSSSQKACLVSYLNGGEFSNWRSVAVQDSLGHLADVACADAWPLTRVFKVDAACDQDWVGKLLSSCFYAEPCKSEHAGMFAVRLRCRIAPSPHLLNLMLRLRQWKTPVHFRVGRGKWSTARLCEERTWALLKDGQEYERRLEVDVPPFGTLLHLKIDTTPAGGGLNDISNSPFTVADLLQAHDFFHAAAGLETDDGPGTDAGTVNEEITEPQRGLRGEIDKLGVLLESFLS
ncbi:hypothetical protein CSOJ01_15748 [Colletotrichum sojae]|uniref:RING-type domain-containing protein n=1 Tax=Colletotrichum sojae TaxID=2175907 RepID=A0A8H6MGU7_9PEZI|nr:hypothetical protein CSOJ01_15748 [Colletotrichum sojae]